MDNYGIGTASWIELIWSAVTFIGALVCATLLYDAYGDLRWLRRHTINGERRLLAVESMVGEAVYVVALMLFALVGLWACFLPSPNPSGKPTHLSIVTGGIFVLVAVSFTTHAFLRRYWRDEYIRRRLKRKPADVPPVTITIDTTDVDSVEVTTQVVAKDPEGAP